MTTINKRVRELEQEILNLKTILSALTDKIQDKAIKPYTKAGSPKDKSQKRPIDVRSGLGGTFGGNMVWNDAEAKLPPINSLPGDPTKGYSKHFHSRFAGGALDINSLELVEYDYEAGEDAVGYNPHCQQFWNIIPPIKQQDGVDKIGLIDISFDSASGKWITSSGSIDVKTTKIVEYAWYKDGVEVDADTEDAVREIKRDDNGNDMESIINGEDDPGSEEEGLRENMVWDKNALCWRFYAVYAD